MIYGYCRISTAKQNIERQERNIKEAFPTSCIIKETFTGTKTSRPYFDKLIGSASEGDTIVFDSVSRMSRDAKSGIEIYQKLYKNGVNLVFLKEPQINTDVYRNALKRASETELTRTGTPIDFILEGIEKYLFAVAEEQITIAFDQAQKEVDDLHQRTREGMVTAKMNGKQIGRAEGTTIETQKSKKAKEIIRKHSKDFGGTLSDAECIILAECSRNSYYKYKSELKESAA